MRELDWTTFANLPGAPTRNWEQLCRAAIRRNFGSKGIFQSVAQQPGVEFHLQLTEPSDEMGVPPRWWGWQCRWYDLPQGRRIGENNRKRISKAIKTTEKWLPNLSDWVLWTRQQLTPDDQNWFYSLPSKMKLHLRSASDLDDLLTGDALPLRESYFGDLILTPANLAALRAEAIAPVQQRYDPALHVKVGAEAVIEKILGNPAGWSELSLSARRVSARAKTLRADTSGWARDDPQRQVVSVLLEASSTTETRLRGALRLLKEEGASQALSIGDQPSPRSVSRWELQRTLSRLRARNEPAALSALDLSAEIDRSIGLLDALVRQLSVEMCSVIGAAGQGKSHLALDLTAADSARVAGVYLQAKRLAAGQTLDDLLKQLLRRPTDRFVELLEALDAAGARENRRLPLIVDGLNEAERPTDWRDLLSGLKSVMTDYPNVLVVLTLRESAVDYALPDGLHNIELPGFGPERDEAVRLYFDHYKLRAARPSRLPWRRFSQPLFLRMYCQVSNPTREKVVDVSSRPTSPTAVYEAFRDEAVRRIATDLLNVAERDVSRALHGVALRLWSSHERSLDFDELRSLVDLAPVPWNKTIAFALEDEGVLMRDPGDTPGRQLSGILFDEFAGFLIADAIVTEQGGPGMDTWLRDHDNLVALSGEQGHPLAADILKGLAGVLPRRAFRSLWPYLEGDARGDALLSATDLEPSEIDAETVAATEDLFKTATPQIFRRLMVRLHDVRADPGHPLNARFTDSVLRKFEVADRDLRWSEWLRREDEPGWPRSAGSVRRDIEAMAKRWADQTERNDEDELLAKWACWMLTSNHRGLRDRATHALYEFGRAAPTKLFRLALAALTINDPYVGDRAMAAAYGVVMANQRAESAEFEPALSSFLAGLTQALHSDLATSPSSHWLIREYATGTWKFASHFHPSLELPADWPDRYKSVEALPVVAEDSDCGRDVARAIGMDFGNYTMGRLYPDRNNYDYDHAGYGTGMGQVRARIAQLGYRASRFDGVESRFGRGRARHQQAGTVERYGKKYSLIAFYELAGRLSDAGELPADPTGRLSDVDIDPSFPQNPAPLVIDMPRWAKSAPADIRRWVRHGQVSIPTQLLRCENLQGHAGPWVLVDGSIRDDNHLASRKVWGHIRSLLVPTPLAAEVLTALASSDNLPKVVRRAETPSDYYTFAGEIPWSDEFAASVYFYDSDPYVSELELPGGRKVSVELVSHEYAWEGYHSDLNQSGNSSVPSRRFAEASRLRRTPDGFDHVDPANCLASQTLSPPEQMTGGGNLLYVREDLLDSYAKSRDRSVILISYGERQPDYELVRSRPRWFLNVSKQRADEFRYAWALDDLR